MSKKVKSSSQEIKSTSYNYRSLQSFHRILSRSGPAASASYTLIGSILIFTYAGWYYDNHNGTSPIALLIGLFLGLIVGFYHLIKVAGIKKY